METDVHAHHALQLVFGIEGQAAMRMSPEGAWQTGGALLVPPNMPHALRKGGEVLMLYLDPDAATGSTLLAALGGRDSAGGFLRLSGFTDGLPPTLPDSDRAWRQARWEDIWNVADNLVTALIGSSPAPVPRLDPRVRNVLDSFRDTQGQPLTLAVAARRVGLSTSRFAHLFSECTGMPLRRYRLWVRLQDALLHAVQHGSVTEAAHHSGFSDAAHLTRTFRDMFGIAPSSILAR